MITVGVSGAPGRMGRLAITAVGERSDLVVKALYAPGHAGEEILGYVCSDDPRMLPLTTFHVGLPKEATW